MKSTSKRHWLWLTGFTAVLTVAYAGYVFMGKEVPAPATMVVGQGNIESSVLVNGVLKPSTLVAVGSQASGRVLSLKVKPGQVVRAGETIAQLEATNQQNELDKARATLRQNEAARDQELAGLELARQDLARSAVMIGKNAVARADYEKAASAVKVKQAQLASSEAAITVSQIGVQIAETSLAYTRIVAPADGTILAQLVQEGQTVNALQTTPTIAILGQLGTMTGEVDISEADITQVREGMPLYFTIAGQSGKRYQAVLEQIEPAPDSIARDRSLSGQTGSSPAEKATAVYYKGLFSIPNPDGALRTYMSTEVHIVMAQARTALLVPVSALRSATQSNRAIVRVMRPDQQTEEREIETGITDKVNVEVLSGLSAGETILPDADANADPVAQGDEDV